MMTDPISDMLTRIRNAGMARHAGHPQLVMTVRYDEDGDPLIDGIKRVSKPGRRVYVNAREVPTVRSGLGIAVISTSKGILSDSSARESSVGGEVVCEVW